MRVWSHSTWSAGAAPSPATIDSSGTRRASSGRLGPAAAAIRSGSTSRTSARSASTIGPNGSPSSPSATVPPSSTNQPRSRSVPASLGHEPALADPGLTTDEDEGVSPGRGSVGRREERLQLARATDEDRAGEPPSHGGHDRAERRPPSPVEGRRRSWGHAPEGRSAGVPAGTAGRMWMVARGLTEVRTRPLMAPRSCPGRCSPPSRAARSSAPWSWPAPGPDR